MLRLRKACARNPQIPSREDSMEHEQFFTSVKRGGLRKSQGSINKFFAWPFFEKGLAIFGDGYKNRKVSEEISMQMEK